MRSLLFAAVLFAALAAPTTASGQTQPRVESPKIVSRLVARTDRTMSGRPLRLPDADAEVVAQIVEIPLGATTTIHQHPWSRFAYVEQGPLTVINHDTNEIRIFRTGEFLSEAVAQSHEGRATSAPVRLIVIDLVPKGQTNTPTEPGNQK